jgi:hypothetical protein
VKTLIRFKRQYLETDPDLHEEVDYAIKKIVQREVYETEASKYSQEALLKRRKSSIIRENHDK